MSNKSNQHYVPQFYFRFFSLDQRSICVLYKKDGKACDTASIKGQASRHKFYGTTEIENNFCTLEGAFSAPLRKLRTCSGFNEISDEEYSLIIQAITFQRSRTLAARSSSHPMYNKLIKLHLETSIKNDNSIEENKKNELIKELPNFEIDPIRPHLEEILTSLQNAHHLIDLVPLILENKTNRPFIFSDSPVIFHNSYCEAVHLRGVLGFSSPGLQVIYPLSEKRTLLLLDSRNYSIKGLKNGNIIHIRKLVDVASLNRLQIHSSYHTIYFSNTQHKDYVRFLWQNESMKFSSTEANVIEALGLDHDGNPLGEIIHTFQPMLPVKLRLTFLKHTILSDHDYISSRR